MEFIGEVHHSERGKNPVIFYRLRADPTKCFKFIHRRNNHYVCYQCSKFFGKDPTVTIYSIGFKDNKFETDPELMEHKCIEEEKLLDYEEVVAKQCYRNGLRLAKKEQLYPSVVDKFVRSRIEKQLGEEAAKTMKGLVTQKNRYSSYSRKLKRKKLEGDDEQEDEESNESDADLEVDIEPEELAELRLLNDQMESTMKHKRVRPAYFPSNLTNLETQNQEKEQFNEMEVGPSSAINVVDDEPVTEVEGNFIGEFGYSKSNKQPIVIYRLKKDPSKCFTFHLRRKTAVGGSYVCSQCVNVNKDEKEQEIVLDTIRLEGDRFKSDPEALYHYCTRAGYSVTYMEAITKQIQRAALILAEEEDLEAQIVDQLLLTELREFFGEDAPKAMAYLPKKNSRMKSYGTRRRVGNNVPRKEPRVTDSGFLYEAQIGYTKDGTNPLLIVRRSDDPKKAYTFVSKRKNWFQCSQCYEAHKINPDRYKNLSIKVTDNVYFNTDPEQHPHSCIEAGFELPYSRVVATQCYRQVFINFKFDYCFREGMLMAQSRELKSNEVDELVIEQIRKNFPDEEEAKECINFLPAKSVRYKGYRNRIMGKTGKQHEQYSALNDEEGESSSNLPDTL